METDQLDQFNCGRSSLNKWLQDHAWHNQVTGVSRTNVVCDTETGQIAGYVSLSAGSITRATLPRRSRQQQPEPVPITLLGQLAIDDACKGQGIGKSLLFFALKTSLQMSKQVGSFGVLTHPLNEEAQAFYAHYGFEPLPKDPHGAMLLRMVDIEKSGF